jgi:DNA-binding response OmpR family regulator
MMEVEKKYSVLIVEDDPGDRFLLQNAISEINNAINIDQVYTGRQVVEFLLRDKVYLDLNRQEMPDLIIANVKEDFFWLNDLQDIRKHKEFDHIPIYLFSSYDSELFKNKALEIGANGFFKKPYTFLDLKFILNTIFNRTAA